MQIENENLLRHSALFSELNRFETERLLKYAHKKTLPANEVIFYQGDEGHQFYLILSGKIQISVASEMGKELTFGILNAGEILGEIAVFSGVQRIATAKTLEKSDLLVIEKCELMPYLKKMPDVAIKIIESLCKRLTVFNEDMEDILFYSLPKRLAKKLLSLMDIYGKENKLGTTINLRLSQTALGHMVSATRESVNKQMKIWENNDLLCYEQGTITIKQEEAMLEIASNE